jgi:L-threonylcarbamoyladenylate synthase
MIRHCDFTKTPSGRRENVFLQTTVIKVNSEQIRRELLEPAARLLNEGRLVAFPTETVYGLGAVYQDESALSQIFATKGRPADNPLIVHVWELGQLAELVREIDPKLQRLIDAFWPGPLTLVFPKKPAVSDLVTAGLDTVAVRMPSHPVARELLRLTKVPVAAPSANLSGKPSPTRAEHVLADFMAKIPMVIDGGPCQAGLESTVLMLDFGQPLILRPGAVTREMVETTLHETVTIASGEASRPQAPGMKYRHYAPRAPVVLVEGEATKVVAQINVLLDELRQFGKVIVIGSTENLTQYQTDLVLDLGPSGHLELAAMRLYDLLRRCDAMGADRIIIEGVNENGIGAAIKNRLRKAAGGNVIHVF